MFDPVRLSLARKRRRLTIKLLAERASLAADTVSRLERGRHKPDEATIAKLSEILGFPADFFSAPATVTDIDTRAVSFRSFSKMSARERDAAISAGVLGLELGGWIEERFNLPKPDLLDLSHEDNPEAAASFVRQAWGLGVRPIQHVIALLETKGVRVFSLSENTASVNAFSFWRDDVPYVFLNNFKTAESSIFDAAHELGHLVLHRHGDPKESRAAEQEANLFASALLMPEEDVRPRLAPYRRRITVDLILKAKRRWRVSAMAMANRLHKLGLISDWQYQSTCIELQRRGYRMGEPDGIERETSMIWRKVLEQLWAEGVTKNRIANDLRLPLDELEGLIWNLVGNAPTPSPKAHSQLKVAGSH